MRDYKKYQVWEKSHALVLDIYRITKTFPEEEKFNLVSQLNRVALSIPTNIVEGCGRESDKEFARFLHISSGSAFELEYLLIVSKDLKILNPGSAQILLAEINEIKKMLFSLIQKLKTKQL